MSQNYIKLDFNIKPLQPGSEVLIAYLGDLGFDSFIQTDRGIEAFIPQKEFDTHLLPSQDEFDFSFNYEMEEIQAQNWNAQWESEFEPVLVENHCVIRAPFHSEVIGMEMNLIIMPKMSFGTGHHHTTWLMTKSLFEFDLKDKSVLDMGCGTGILAIAAKKRGARQVVGIDIDEWSITNSIENEEMNEVDGILWIQGNVNEIPKTEFDFIFANINKNVLLNDIPSYFERLSLGGTLVLSGFFSNDSQQLIQRAFEFGLHFKKENSKENWSNLVFEKK